MPKSTLYPHRARVAARRRHYGPDHPATRAAEQALAEAKRDKRTDDLIRALVASAPPLTDEQRAKLRAILSPGTAERAT